ncbi:hypothetical protein Q3G72_017917 [Acer saccharum]|nr:hypothetical protein Q3G72_017917 [Acer saccharum]
MSICKIVGKIEWRKLWRVVLSSRANNKMIVCLGRVMGRLSRPVDEGPHPKERTQGRLGLRPSCDIDGPKDTGVGLGSFAVGPIKSGLGHGSDLLTGLDIGAGKLDSDCGGYKAIGSGQMSDDPVENFKLRDLVEKRDLVQKQGGGRWKRQAQNKGKLSGYLGTKLVRGKRGFIDVLVEDLIEGGLENGEKKGRCTQQLRRWNTTFRRSRQAEMETLQKEISAASSVIQPNSWSVIQKLESRLDCLMSEEKEY